jgi:uncharacterized protein YprB with RNaseH-like and TPR domain
MIRDMLESSVAHRDNIRFFTERLAGCDLWRLFPRFHRRVVYVDIETSGNNSHLDEITVIGAYDGSSVHTFVNGINLEAFEVFIAPYEIMVTFNGSCFDVPYIRRWFRNIALPPAHIDLRFLLNRLGYGGGLKKIEKRLGIFREPAVEGMDGYDAVQLWEAHQWGDPDALGRLIDYNTEDIVNLKPLMEMGYREMRTKTLGTVQISFHERQRVLEGPPTR